MLLIKIRVKISSLCNDNRGAVYNMCKYLIEKTRELINGESAIIYTIHSELKHFNNIMWVSTIPEVNIDRV